MTRSTNVMEARDAKNEGERPDEMDARATGAGAQSSDRRLAPGATLQRTRTGDLHKMNRAPIPGAIFDHGQIETIKLPDGWVESEEDFYSTVGTRSLRVFHPPNARNAV